MKVQIFTLIVFLTAVPRPALSQHENPPLTQEQVLELVKFGMNSAELAGKIKQVGIDFAPDEGYLQTLQKAGAQAEVIDALRAAEPRPLTAEQVGQLVVGGVPSRRAVALVKQRGIDFVADEKYLETLRVAGAQDELIDALRTTPHRSMPAPASPNGPDELAQGVALYQDSQLTAATKHLEKAAQNDPQSVKAWLYLGSAYAQQITPADLSQKDCPRCVQAREAFEHVVKIDAVNKVALAGLGVVAFLLKDPDQARGFEEKRWNLDPADAQAALSLGFLDWMLCYNHDFQLRQQLGMANSQQPLPESARAELETQNSKLVEEGMNALSKALELQPGDRDVFVWLNMMYRQKAEIEHDGEARANDLKSADSFLDKARAVQTPTAAGEMVKVGGDKDFAVLLAPLTSSPLNRPPPPPPDPSAKPNAPLDQFQFLALLIDGVPHERIVEVVKQRGVTNGLHKWSPPSSWLRGLGVSAGLFAAVRSANTFPDRPGSQDELTARNQFLDKLKEDPRNHAALMGMVMLENRINGVSPDEVIPVMRNAVTLEPANPWTHFMLATALSAAGTDDDAAMVEYRRVLQLDPNYPAVHAGIAWLLSRNHDSDGAIMEYREDIRLNPMDSTGARQGLVEALIYTGRSDEAIAAAEEWLRLDPQDADAHYESGRALLSKGDQQQALEEFRKAYELEPDNDGYKTAYQELLKAQTSGPVQGPQ